MSFSYSEAKEELEIFSSLPRVATLHNNYKLIGYQETINLGGTVLKEEMLTSSLGIGMVTNNFLIELLDEIVQGLNNGGIVRFLFKLDIELRIPRYEEPPKNPNVLSTDDLNFGFFIWFMAAGISTLCFIFELLLISHLKKIKNWIKKFLQNQLGVILLKIQLKRILKKNY